MYAQNRELWTFRQTDGLGRERFGLAGRARFMPDGFNRTTLQDYASAAYARRVARRHGFTVVNPPADFDAAEVARLARLDEIYR